MCFSADDPLSAGRTFGDLMSCTNYADPNSCKIDLFWRAVQNTVLVRTAAGRCMVGFALLTALILNRRIRRAGLLPQRVLLPGSALPGCRRLDLELDPADEGVLNASLKGWACSGVNWLLSPRWAFGWAVFMSIWAHMGFYTLILLAGLQAIPRDVYEAALMDAANPWRTFRRITLPLLMPTMVVVLVLALIKGVQTFDEVYAFTGGGPGSATTLLIQYIYEPALPEPRACSGWPRPHRYWSRWCWSP